MMGDISPTPGLGHLPYFRLNSFTLLPNILFWGRKYLLNIPRRKETPILIFPCEMELCKYLSNIPL